MPSTPISCSASFTGFKREVWIIASIFFTVMHLYEKESGNAFITAPAGAGMPYYRPRRAAAASSAFSLSERRACADFGKPVPRLRMQSFCSSFSIQHLWRLCYQHEYNGVAPEKANQMAL